MPQYLCQKCGVRNRVPAGSTHFICQNCGQRQDLQTIAETANEALLNDMVLEPEAEKELDTSSLFNRFAAFENVHIYEEDTSEIRAQEGAPRKDGIYYTALSKMGGDDPRNYEKAMRMLQSLGAWKDAPALVEECKAQITAIEQRAQQQKAEARRRSKQRKLCLGIGIPARAAEPCVRDDARGVVASHAVGKPWARPLRKPSGLLPTVLEPLCHQRVHLGIGEVEKREKRAERIPESRPDIERSLEDAAGRGAPVHRLLRSRINVVVRAREKR